MQSLRQENRNNARTYALHVPINSTELCASAGFQFFYLNMSRWLTSHEAAATNQTDSFDNAFFVSLNASTGPERMEVIHLHSTRGTN